MVTLNERASRVCANDSALSMWGVGGSQPVPKLADVGCAGEQTCSLSEGSFANWLIAFDQY